MGCVTYSFLMVLLCLILSVLSTIDQFEQISVEILFYMVGENAASVMR
jgi:hypothetical protein